METLAKFLRVPEPGPNEVPAPVAGPEAVDPWAGAETVKEFAQRVLDSKEYRSSLYRRVLVDELPPQIELMLYYYAAGKPTERVEHTGKDGKPIETVSEVRRIIVRTSQRNRERDENEPDATVTH